MKPVPTPPLSKSISTLGLIVCAASLLAMAACGVAEEADVLFATSFENDEIPGYSEGTLKAQNEWVLSGAVKASAEVVSGGTEGDPAAPDGHHLLRLKNLKDHFDKDKAGPYANLQFSQSPLTGQLHFSGLTAFSGSVSEKTGHISRIYLSEAGQFGFHGAALGIWQDQGELRFFVMDESNRGGKAHYVSFGDEHPKADTFYRFEADVDIVTKQYEVRVYDPATNRLLAESGSRKFRNKQEVAMNYLRLNNACNPSINGDDFTTYYDKIEITQ